LKEEESTMKKIDRLIFLNFIYNYKYIRKVSNKCENFYDNLTYLIL